MSDDAFVKDIAARVGTLEKTLGDVRADVSAIKTKVDHVPTRAELYLAALGILIALIGGLWQFAQGPLMKMIIEATRAAATK